MSERLEINPRGVNPRHVERVVGVLVRGGLIAYPTDSGYALGWRTGNRKAQERVVRIRQLGPRHHFTFCCRNLSEVGNLARLDNRAHRLIRQVTPGPFTFILPASTRVPKFVQQRKSRTIGVRIPDHTVVQSILGSLDEPLLSSSLLLPGMGEDIFDSEDLFDAIDGLIDLFVDAGYCRLDPTTLVDLTGSEPVVLRQGPGVLDF